MQTINIGDIYEMGTGLICIYAGGYLFAMHRGYIPFRPDEATIKQAEEWRKNYGTFAYFMAPMSVIFGVYHIITTLLRK